MAFMRSNVCLVLFPFAIIISSLFEPVLALPTTTLVSNIIAQGLLRIKGGSPELALAAALKAIELNPSLPESYFLLGRAQQDIGLKSDSINSYSRAIFFNPRYIAAYSNRGLVKAAMGDYVEAIKDFDQAIKINEKYAPAYLNRGVALGATGNASAALSDFSKAININPKYVEAYLNRGIAKELIGDPIGACSDWKIAATYGSTEALIWHKNQCL